MASANNIWDCVIIGGGVIGLSTAYHLTKSGCKVLILEQFHVPHTRGSSHGQSRLIRECHDIEQYTALTKVSYDLWRDIEKESGKELLVQTGLILLQDGEAPEIKRAAELMDKHQVDYDTVTGNDIRNKYPMIRYSDDYKGVLDKSASILLADTCLRTLSNLVESHGGVIKDGVQVSNIQPGATVMVHTNKGQFKAKKVIVATGSWSKEILQNLGLNVPLKTMPGRVCYWKLKNPRHYNASHFPSVLEYIFHDKGYDMIYSVPMYEFPGLVKTMAGAHVFWRTKIPNSYTFKQLPIFYNLVGPSNGVPYENGFVGMFPCLEYSNLVKTMPGCHAYWKSCHPEEYVLDKIPQVHESFSTSDGYRFYLLFPSVEYPGHVKVVTRGEPPAFYCHPDDRDSQSMHQMIDLLSDYIKKHFPGLETKPSIIEPCMYCMTPDKCAIMDKHPNFSNIIIGTAFSGKGFMIAPVAGQILGDLAMDRRVNWDLSIFSLKRFTSPTPSKL